MATFNLSLDTSKQSIVPQAVRTRLGDGDSCTVVASVTENGAAYDFSGKTARFECMLPDETVVRDADVEIDGSTLTYTVPAEVIRADGMVRTAYFRIMKGTAQIDSTESFTLDVKPGIDAGGLEVPRDYLPELDEALAAMKQQVKDAQGGEQERQSDFEESQAERQGDYEVAEAARDAAYEAAEAERGEAFEAAEAGREADQSANNDAQAENDAAQQKNNSDQAANNAAAQGLVAVILGEGEYDPETLEPTIEGAVGKMYLVPLPQAQAVAAAIPVRFSLSSQEDGTYVATQAEAAEGDTYVEWLWISSTWERIGLSTATIDPITTDQIDAVCSDSAPQGKQVLNLTGLSYLWAKLKAAFAAIAHTHAASDVTGLTASRVLVSDASGHPAASAVTATELGYLDGVTSGVQGQIDALGDSLSHAMSDGDIRFKWERVPGADESNYGLFMYFRENARSNIPYPMDWSFEVESTMSTT